MYLALHTDITGCDVSGTSPSVILWQFGQDREVMSYHGCLGKVNRVHFDQFGQKFGAADAKGSLSLWRFDANLQSSKPYYTIACHSKATRDFSFLDSSSVLATAGTSLSQSKANNLCIWDTLLPSTKSLVCALPAHESGAYATVYSSKNEQLLSGGKNGEITVTDIRQRAVMHTFNGHNSRIRSLTVDYKNGLLLSGSVDGDLKVSVFLLKLQIWDLETLTERHTWGAQARNRFLNTGFDRIQTIAQGIII
ncbi:WD40-repeat-containing domain protein [Endogone sp. FLAS-F59071]|nr:WD40-repeat-containing domain protein [Endogone sp. FLAS-F59071]|eukprot:RUS22784.1 WD40-repeat-containing domain protein [Endogone sp. FLAS-F59071]